MSDEFVFTLGEVETARILPRPQSADVDTPTAKQRPRVSNRTPTKFGASLGPWARRIDSRLELTAGISLLLPGSGRLARGDVSVGLFFVSSFGFLAALSWAVLNNLNSLTETLEILSLRREGAVWVLVGAYAAAAALYVANVICAVSSDFDSQQPPHPAVPGVASLILPGLGQVYNRDRRKAAMLLGALWVAGATWLLAWSATQSLLESIQIHLPPPVLQFCSPTVRWSLLAVIWALGVYDAVFTAKSRHRSE